MSFSTEFVLAQKSTGTITESGDTRPYLNNQSDQHKFFHLNFAISYQKKVGQNIWIGIRPSLGWQLKRRSILGENGLLLFEPPRSPKTGVAVYMRFST